MTISHRSDFISLISNCNEFESSTHHYFIIKSLSSSSIVRQSTTTVLHRRNTRVGRRTLVDQEDAFEFWQSLSQDTIL